MLLRSLKRPRRRCRILRGDAGTSVAGRRRHGVAHRPTQAPRPGSPGIVPYKHRDAPQVNRLREAIRVGGARPGSTIQMTTAGSASMPCLRAGVGLTSSRIAARPGTVAAVGRDSAGTLPQPHVRPPVPPAGCLPARSCPQASAIAGRHAVILSQPEALWISRRGMAAIQLRWNGSVDGCRCARLRANSPPEASVVVLPDGSAMSPRLVTAARLVAGATCHPAMCRRVRRFVREPAARDDRVDCHRDQRRGASWQAFY